jgi:hypothetical protein
MNVKQQIKILKRQIVMLYRDIAKRPTLVKLDNLRAMRKKLEELEKQK